jgi:hypothetical protein
MAREIDQSGADDILASSWSEGIDITVYLPENENPIVTAKAGIFVNGVGLFSDTVDYAKTGDEITYSGADSFDPDGDDSKLEYSWVIWDSRGNNVILSGDKTKKTFQITYYEPGTYTGILTVTDERGGVDTWQVDVIVSKSGGYDDLDDNDEGLSNTMIAGIAGIGVAVLAGLAVGLRNMGGGGDDGFDDMFEDVTPGPLELNCPTCNGLISITTTQRPIQVGCPMCQSQFIIRE